MIQTPYLLFLGDAPDQLSAKVAQGIKDWRPDFALGQLRMDGCNADMGLPDMTLAEAKAAGVKTVVIGVNDDELTADHNIVSNASCTTNCLAPAAKVISDGWGIARALMTTIHSYTNDQRILDVAHSDPRRARAASLNLVPASTGAAAAIARVIPELEGRFGGFSIRVPTPTVSIVDFTAELERSASIDAIHAAFRAAEAGPMKGILGVSDEPLVSSDYKGDTRSSIIDTLSTMMVGDKFVKIVTWYDNEWGYSCRVADLVKYVATHA